MRSRHACTPGGKIKTKKEEGEEGEVMIDSSPE